jgi:hypothetical protein
MKIIMLMRFIMGCCCSSDIKDNNENNENNENNVEEDINCDADGVGHPIRYVYTPFQTPYLNNSK